MNLESLFSGLNILVIGDAMIDSYIWGAVNRMSPEAPVPVVDVERKESRLGGAANVALNISELGANAKLCAVVGNDNSKEVLVKLLEKRGLTDKLLVVEEGRMTTEKTRIINKDEHIARYDFEVTHDIHESTEAKIINLVSAELDSDSIDAIIFQDYDKGLLTKKLVQSITAIANERGIPTMVDPKKKGFWNYENVTVFKPNLKEIREAIDEDVEPNIESLGRATIRLHQKLNNQNTVVTLSEYGVFYFGGNNESAIIPAHKRNIVDVSGAGDTVISVLALCIAAKLSLAQSTAVANLAGGLVCEQAGVIPISLNTLQLEVNSAIS